jgi:tRNA dimethylallyltransferase
VSVQNKNKTVVIVAGPTAVGKTAFAIQLALHFQSEIISADSRQCYRELKIGVARPSEEELAIVPHHFIASHGIQDNITAADFEQYALQKAGELFQRHQTIVVTGGTGLYIKAFCEGFDAVPQVPAEVREKIIREYEEKGMAWLQETIRLRDPRFYQFGEVQNPQRMLRALEVRTFTGKSILEFRTGNKAQRDFEIVKLGIEIPREELKERIGGRVDQMMQAGLLEEVKSLLPYRHLNALQTVGYAELFRHLDGEISLADAVQLIKTHTRQYAKRQMTWFKKDPEIHWISADTRKALEILKAH